MASERERPNLKGENEMIQISCDFCPNKEVPRDSTLNSEFKFLNVSTTGDFGGGRITRHICLDCCKRLGFPIGKNVLTPEEALVEAIEELIERNVEQACSP